MGKHQPAILGGVFIGALSSLPVIQSCCCLWMLAGGVLVVYLQQQRSAVPIATSDAAIGGLLAGAIGGFIATVVQSLLLRGTAPMMLEEFRSRAGDIPPEAMQFIERLFGGSGIGLFLILVCMWVPIYAVFAMGGSFIGLAIFRKKVPPQPQV